jgi:tetratricopeptide (TPR) repeat protein
MAHRFRVVVLLAALIVLPAGQRLAAAEESASEKVARTATRGTVLVWVQVRDRLLPNGTGWLVDAERKLLVTNHHVVGNALVVRVTFPKFRDGKVISDARSYPAKEALAARVLDSDPRRDLAILQLKGKLPREARALKLADSEPSPGQKLLLVGQPAASDGWWVVTTGTVRALVRKTARIDGQSIDAATIESQMATNPGDSGAAVLNEDGEVVGINFSGKPNARLLASAIRVSDLKPLLAEVRTLLEPDKAPASAFLQRGLRYLSKGQTRQAIADFSQAVKRDEDLAAAYRHRARAYCLLRDYDAAVDDARQAVKLGPDDALAHNELGNAYSGKGEQDEAIAAYDKALRLEPSNAIFYWNRGDSYHRKNDLARALKDYSEAIRLDSRCTLAYRDRGVVHHQMKKYELAIKDYQAALFLERDNQGPATARIWNWLGNAQAELKRYEMAVDAFGQALKLKHPEPGVVWSNLGFSLFSLGRKEKAVEAFDQAVRINPRNAEALFWRGSVHEAMGKTALAHQDYTRAVKLDASWGRQAKLHRTKYLQLANRTSERLRIWIRYQTRTTDGDWSWYPGEEKFLFIDLAPGAVTKLRHDNWNVHARKVRIWAESRDSDRVWQRHKDRDVNLSGRAEADMEYRARRKATYTYTFWD